MSFSSVAILLASIEDSDLRAIGQWIERSRSLAMAQWFQAQTKKTLNLEHHFPPFFSSLCSQLILITSHLDIPHSPCRPAVNTPLEASKQSHAS
jgi:hypothetical protein